MKNLSKLLGPDEAAEYLGISDKPNGGKRTLKQLRDKRRIPYYKIGNRTIVYPRNGLDMYLESVRVAARGEAA